jgi:iron complex outermembrane receptor protein
VLELGEETVLSGFGQLTHRFSDSWVATAGVRYDGKVRHEGDTIHVLSPQVGLRYLPNENWDVVLSFSESYADAPYWYRYNAIPSYRGGRNLKPEYLKTLQLTPAVTLSTHVKARVNLFYSTLEHAIWRNKNAGPTEPIYQNGGFLKSWGVEPEVSYSRAAFNVAGHLTYQRASGARNYDVTGSQVNNVPNWTWSVIMNVNPLPAAKKDVWFNVTARYIGAQVSPINITIGTTTFNEPGRIVDRAFVVNTGVRVGSLWARRCFLDARVYNLFDRAYEQGGSVSHPYPQQGRSGMLTVGFAF